MPVLDPVPVDALPVAPDPNDRATFEPRAYLFTVALGGPFRTQMNAIAVNVSSNATYAATSATASAASASASAASASDAYQSASLAASTANFKGNWSDLTGALNMPACVRHSGRFWVLLANLANVTTAVPGVSASWAALDAGTVPSQLLSTASATVNAVVGVRNLFAANNVTLNAPTSAIKGDYHGWRRMAGVTGCTSAWGATKVRGGTPGTLAVDIPEIDLFYEDATQGYI